MTSLTARAIALSGICCAAVAMPPPPANAEMPPSTPEISETFVFNSDSRVIVGDIDVQPGAGRATGYGRLNPVFLGDAAPVEHQGLDSRGARSIVRSRSPMMLDPQHPEVW
jgi:hypothetical protein